MELNFCNIFSHKNFGKSKPAIIKIENSKQIDPIELDTEIDLFDTIIYKKLIKPNKIKPLRAIKRKEFRFRYIQSENLYINKQHEHFDNICNRIFKSHKQFEEEIKERSILLTHHSTDKSLINIPDINIDQSKYATKTPKNKSKPPINKKLTKKPKNKTTLYEIAEEVDNYCDPQININNNYLSTDSPKKLSKVFKKSVNSKVLLSKEDSSNISRLSDLSYNNQIKEKIISKVAYESEIIKETRPKYVKALFEKYDYQDLNPNWQDKRKPTSKNSIALSIIKNVYNKISDAFSK